MAMHAKKDRTSEVFIDIICNLVLFAPVTKHLDSMAFANSSALRKADTNSGIRTGINDFALAMSPPEEKSAPLEL